MAPQNHVLEVGEAPTVNPNANAGDDYFHIQASPDAFGGQIGRAEEGFGQAVTNVGTTALEIQTQKQNIQDDLHNSDVNTWHDRSANNLWSNYSKLQGQAAIDALPKFQSDLEELRHKAIDQAGNDNSRAAISKSTAYTTDNYNKYATNYADAQFKNWRETSDTLHAANQGSQSTITALQGDFAASDVHLAASGNVIALNARAKGYDEASIDQMVKANTGSHVMNTVQQMALVGKNGQPDIPSAEAYYAKYKDHMDPTSQVHLEEWLKSRVIQYDGQQAANKALSSANVTHRYTDPSLPTFAQAAQANPGSMSPRGMAILVHTESSGNPNAGAGTSHVGLVQASTDYWNRYGEGSRLDPNASIAALARSTAADSKYLTPRIGQQPTDGQLYVAHQQGPAGAVALINNPNLPAGQALMRSGAYKTQAAADNAIRSNLGDPNAPASVFVNKWTARFDGPGGSVTPGGGQTFQMPAAYAGTYRAPYSRAVPDPLAPIVNPQLALDEAKPAPPIPDVASPAQTPTIAPTTTPQQTPDEQEVQSPMSRKAAAYSAIINDPTLSDEVRQHALTVVNQQIQAQAIAEEADAKSKSDLSEKTAGTYFERIENGDAKDLAPQIINDRRMKYETRHALLDLLERSTGDRNVKNYGSGYADAYKRIMLPENDPNRIVDPLELYRQGAPGGPLTPSGVGKLSAVLNAIRRNTDDAAVNRVKSSMLTYANEKMTYTIPSLMPGQPDKRDVKGTMLFNSQFVPRLEAEYDSWIKAGKSPWDANSPIAKKNVDALIEQIRPQRQMAQDQMGHQPDQPEAPDAPLPPPPRGVNQNGWVQVVSRPPMTTSGESYGHAKWASKINILLADPTPRRIEQFNQAFGRAGYDGKEILSALRDGVSSHLEPAPVRQQPAPIEPEASGPL